LDPGPTEHRGHILQGAAADCLRRSLSQSMCSIG
jgi:hypothetical protein